MGWGPFVIIGVAVDALTGAIYRIKESKYGLEVNLSKSEALLQSPDPQHPTTYDAYVLSEQKPPQNATPVHITE